MFNKKSNKTLWIVFAILLVGTILIFTTESTKKERSFKKDLVSIDTAKVSEILIYPKSQKGSEVKLTKSNSSWSVTTKKGKQYLVPKAKIKNLLNQLLAIKPKRLASRSEKKFNEYEVNDSAATKIVVNEGSSEVLNLIIGKFAFQQPRSMSTFVRLADDTDIYEVDGFLDMTFNKKVNDFRDETVINSDKNKWNKLRFEYSNSESFEIVNNGNAWLLEGGITDSTKTDKALSDLVSLTNNLYIDVNENSLPPVEAKLIIENDLGEPIIITSYRDSSKYIIHSSQNNDSYFDGKKNGSKIFLNKNSFLK
ncbi:MAG: DUF4340 domain-containing protein [Melioribacteraceae bacterium]